MLDVVTSFFLCNVLSENCGYDLSVEQYFLLLSFDGDIFFIPWAIWLFVLTNC